jgi:type VI secretion system secreted protein Hcp
MRRMISMRKKWIWIAAALVLVAIPAVVGLVVVGGDDDRRAGALIQMGTGSHELKMDGLVIPGASSTHVIDVESWSWGVSNQSTLSAGALRTAGAAKFNEMTITKTVDNSSPQLFLACANGKHFPKVTITSRKAGDQPVEYLVITLEQVLISSVEFSGNKGGDIPMENVTLNFAKATIESKGTADGKVLTPSRATWDVALNKGS